MKAWRRIQKVAVVSGTAYGLWLGSNVCASSTDIRSALVIVILACVVAISLVMPETQKKEQEKSL